MSDQSLENPQHRTPSVVNRLTITLGAIGLGLWWWVNQNSSSLPSPESKPGRVLLRQYQGTVHDIWLILLVIALGYLINRIYTHTRRESLNPQERFHLLCEMGEWMYNPLSEEIDDVLMVPKFHNDQ